MTMRTGGPNGSDRRDPAAESDSAGGVLPRPGRSPLLVAFVVCVFLALGFDAGLAAPIALVVAAALGVVAGACLLGAGSGWFRVLGSTVVGSSLLVGSVAILDRAIPPATAGELAGVGPLLRIAILVAIGCGVGGTGYALVVGRGGWVTLGEAMRDAAVATVLVTPVLAAVLDRRFLRTLGAGGASVLDAATTTPAIALLSLQVVGACTAVVAMAAGRTIERTLGRPVPIPTLDAAIDGVRSWPEIWYWLLAGYAAVWFVPGVPEAIDAALASLGVIGRMVGALLQSGIAHGLLAGVLALCFCAVVGDELFAPLGYWLEPSPARTLSLAAGGIVVPVAVLVGGTAGTERGLFGLSVLALLSLSVPAMAAWVAAHALSRIEPSRSRLVGVATAVLFAATMGLAVVDMSPLGVLIGVATVLLAWDLATNALAIHRSVGADVDASGPIATHATTVVAVVALGAALGGIAIVAATVGGRHVGFGGAETTVGLLLVAVLVVATAGLRLPAVRFGVRERLPSWRRAAPSNRTALWTVGVALSLLLGWLVSSGFYFLTIALVIAVPSVLFGESADGSVSPRRRF